MIEENLNTKLQNIRSVTGKINKNEDRLILEEGFLWDLITRFNKAPYEISTYLPFTKKKVYPFNAERILSVLHELAGDHSENNLIRLFSLFESLINRALKIKYGEKTSEIRGIKEIKKFIKNDMKISLSGKEENELDLIYKTRNRYVHGGGMANGDWITFYKKTGGMKSIKEGDRIKEILEDREKEIYFFSRLQDWNRLIVKISNEIENKIKTL
ncbi:MAG: hypothetical protein COV33_02545 [Candidatus Zambryskibacteria bacterium CG10_big_fil_rev_8_21_14_0_10_34_34]|uniref:Apea-like HEPN domain-containing protein n=1 Tax=Candidatus Zambryskibacteria bacterium CG10_big_fil_rev_8_21_14_0_10_34_34 TaxID=1975114 RepID=A0A2H0R0A4_9BACT|nr:MAG: hypothetical protein COV33_02545 [Candidatus Zambryskibacteria bacterium CG10_big_fil_rev_8_21_14_0_10_34_34]